MTQATLTTRIIESMTKTLDGASGTMERASINNRWISGMMRMRKNLGARCYSHAEGLQDTDFNALAEKLNDVSPRMICDNIPINKSVPNYAATDCFITQTYHMMGKGYSDLESLVKGTELSCAATGTRTLGTIIFSCLWAYFLLFGRVMTKPHYDSLYDGIYADMKLEKGRRDADEWATYMVFPTNTRLNYEDHKLIDAIEQGAHTLTPRTHKISTHIHTHPPHSEEKLERTSVLCMRALADIAMLRNPADMNVAVRHRARDVLKGLVDQYHAQHPETPISLAGTGILRFISNRAQVLRDQAAAAQEAAQEKIAAQAAEAEAAAALVLASEREARKVEERVLAKASANQAKKAVDDAKWALIQEVHDEFERSSKKVRQKTGLHEPGWNVWQWPADLFETTGKRDEWMAKEFRKAVKIVWCDIRFVPDESLPLYLSDAGKRVVDLLGSRVNYTFCLLGTTSQTPSVSSSLGQSEGWKWATPYTIQLDSASHTLGADDDELLQVHQICKKAHDEGDNTFGVDHATVYRLLRGNETSSTIRGRPGSGPGESCWHAGRGEFRKHCKKDVPSISWPKSKGITREPYKYSLDISSSLPHAEEYPLEFAFTNFIYWHTRINDAMLILQDVDDIFGTTALYCNRRVLVAPLSSTLVDAEDEGEAKLETDATFKGYKAMSVFRSQGGSKFFDGYPSDALFATMSRLVRNMRKSRVESQGILFSQTAGDKYRWKRKNFPNLDLETPCELVKLTLTRLPLYHMLTITRLPLCLLKRAIVANTNTFCIAFRCSSPSWTASSA